LSNPQIENTNTQLENVIIFSVYMTFNRSPFLYSYSINHNALLCFFSAQDLGVLFDHKVSYNL